MIRYYCDRCNNEIKPDQYHATPCICQYKEEYPKMGVVNFTMTQSDLHLCVVCMRKYINFLKAVTRND